MQICDYKSIFELGPQTAYGVLGSSIDRSKLKELKIPEQLRDEVPTLNRTGYMKLALDTYSQEFVEHAGMPGCLSLEIGSAYGFVIDKVLRQNSRIIAADISVEHLTIIAKRALEAHLDNLYLYQGSFPTELDFPAGSIDAILISRVMHFLTGEEIEQGLAKMHQWLTAEGKLYFTVVSPYHKAVRDGFLAVYQNRVKARELWPGVIESQWDIAPQHKPYVQPYLHVFDVEQLQELLPKHGFKIQRISLFDYPGEPSSDNKGHVGFVATKM